jgi:hypothetical protein
VLEFKLARDDGSVRKEHSHPAGLIEAPPDDHQLVGRTAAITQLAEQLDRGTLEVALRIVPIQWWRDQLRAAATTPLPASRNEGGPV